MAVLTVTMSAMAVAVVIMVSVSATVVVVVSVPAVAVIVVPAVMVVNGFQLRQAYHRQDGCRYQVQHRRVVEQVIKVDSVQPAGDEWRRGGQYEPGS